MHTGMQRAGSLCCGGGRSTCYTPRQAAHGRHLVHHAYEPRHTRPTPRSHIASSIRCQSINVDVATTGQPGAVGSQTPLTLRLAAVSLPHPDKAHYGGEDAHFVSDVDGGAFGVADGVGGWQENGINPADYSKTLMQTARNVLEGSIDISSSLSSDNSEHSSSVLASLDSGDADPSMLSRCVRTALAVAHTTTRLPGSSTACIVRLDRAEGVLRVVNLGDSGFILIRNGTVVFKTRALEHFFDCPYQLGSFPDYTDATDTVDDAEVHDVPVMPGDVIVAGSDGLWDNCYEHEMMPLLPTSSGEVQDAATRIAAVARANAEDPQYESPYTREALNEGLDLPPWEKLFKSSIKDGKFVLGKLQGGKQDDITVLVAYVNADDAEESAL